MSTGQTTPEVTQVASQHGESDREGAGTALPIRSEVPWFPRWLVATPLDGSTVGPLHVE